MDARLEDEIIKSFRRFDADRDGVITRSELRRVLQTLDPNAWTDESVGILLQAADVDRDGKIQYNEFVDWMLGTTAARRLADDFDETRPHEAPSSYDGARRNDGAQHRKEIASAFKKFDANRDGVISRGELADVLQKLDPDGWTEEKVGSLLAAADINRDGRIQYNEFVEWVMDTTSASHLAGSIAGAPSESEAGSTLALLDSEREANIAAAFEKFDSNNDGMISRSELADMLQRLDPLDWPDDKVSALLEAADINRDGCIQYNEFIAWAFGEDSGSPRIASKSSSELQRMMSQDLEPLGVAASQRDRMTQPTELDARNDSFTISIVQLNGILLLSATVTPDQSVADLCSLASQALRGQPCRLVIRASCTPLLSHMTLREAGLREGAAISAVVTSSIRQLASNTRGAYAALKGDGSVVTWGGADVGGDSSLVAESLRDGVTTVVATESAFAALKSDGSVICWGRGSYGGKPSGLAAPTSQGLVNSDSSNGLFWSSAADEEDEELVAERLRNGVIHICTTSEAFAALKADGSVVTWGNVNAGAAAVAHLLSEGVESIVPNHLAFAALKTDGSVVTWGCGSYGGGELGVIANASGTPADELSVAADLMREVMQVFCTSSAFAALKVDGSVVAWGDAGFGGEARLAEEQLRGGVASIAANERAFAALKFGGAVVTWGQPSAGGCSDQVAEQLRSGVKRIVASSEAFAALKDDGSVVTWGAPGGGGDSRSVALALTGSVVDVVATGSAFAALREDGSVVAWGGSDEGGCAGAAGAELQGGVARLFSTEAAFAALKEDHSVVTWGAAWCGGEPGPAPSGAALTGPAAELLREGVTEILAAKRAFAAVKADGSHVLWGEGIEPMAVAKLQPMYAPVAAG